MSSSLVSLLNTTENVDSLRELLLQCCSCNEWVNRMLSHRPFNGDDAELLKLAKHEFLALAAPEWLEAFRAHPRIGASNKELEGKQSEASEQSGTRNASAQTMNELHSLNEEYYSKFGFVFLICATGKTADEMLASLKERLSRSKHEELREAALQQAQISELRLKKLVRQGISSTASKI